ncbi:hypothetical protein KZZ52_18715 [Dactylosporangium sp. AC04546]|uniref:WXG100 family type VII secretion target n=1 Tax=Dactylosporangium sp. AC04546 TaxID=2862460 RepID=UPI001EDF3E76|nr:WXG100 family type VII secretion target [Dactylosporangium sp. AC04546]WVK87336.1 hypothetical protein KZZ52_18715 [Dactylosporangium sp. AC04546]
MHVKIVGEAMDAAAASAQGAAKQLEDQANDLFRLMAGAGGDWDDDGALQHLENHQYQMKQTGYHVHGLHTETSKWSGVGYVGRETKAGVLRDLGSI